MGHVWMLQMSCRNHKPRPTSPSLLFLTPLVFWVLARPWNFRSWNLPKSMSAGAGLKYQGTLAVICVVRDMLAPEPSRKVKSLTATGR